MIPVFPQPLVGRSDAGGSVVRGERIPAGDQNSGGEYRIPAGDQNSGGDRRDWQDTI